MENVASSLTETLTANLQHGTEGVFGLARRNGDGDLILVTRRRAFPVLFAQLELETENRHFQWTETDWAGELLVDDKGCAPSNARLAFTGPGLIVDSSEDSFIGTLTVLAVPHPDAKKVLGLEAIFCCKSAEPQSSVLWDTSPEMVHHWHSGLLRRRENGPLS